MYLHEDREQFADAVRKSVQHTNMLVDIAEELGMNISNLEDTRSRRDYNRYQIEYKSAFEIGEIPISSFVLVETSFTVVQAVENIRVSGIFEKC